jgi:ankyrin repeat protein
MAAVLAVSLAAFLPCLSHAGKPIPAGPDARTEENFRKAKYEWLIRETAAPYDTAGKKNPQYDDKVRAFLKDFCFDSLWPDKSPGKAKLREDAKAIARAGCDDPLFLRAYGCVLPDDALTSKRIELFQKALDGFMKGGYPRINVFQAALDLYGLARDRARAADTRDHLQSLGITAIAEAIAGGEFAPGERQVAYRLLANSLLQDMRESSLMFPEKCWGDLFASLSKRQGVDVWLLRMIQGKAEVSAAWQARGGGYADTVTPAGWAGFRDHLTKAYAALTEAWKLHPEYPEAPALLVKVAMGGVKGTGEGERTWFDRAVAAQMDYLPAYDALLWALRPRWGGSYKEMYLFGLECLNTKRFDTWVPMWYLNTMKDIASEYPENRWHEAFQQPKIDECLDQLFAGMLKANPDNPNARDLLLAQHAFAAIWCGKFDKAKAILAQVQSKDVSIPRNVYDRSMVPQRAGRGMAAMELHALTSPQGSLLLDAWASGCEGNKAKTRSLLEKALEESKGDPRVYAYALDRYGFLLLSEKTKDNASLSMDGSALYYCAQDNHPDVAAILLDKGADVNAESGSGLIPLSRAAEKGHAELALLLMKHGANVNAVGPGGWTALHMASYHGHTGAAMNLLAKGANLEAETDDRRTPLFLAIQMAHAELAKRMIEMGANVNTVGERGVTPLHLAVLSKSTEVARLLIEKGANINATDSRGYTPLLSAVCENSADMMRLLVEKGANVNASEKAGYTALSTALRKEQPGNAAFLIDHGADINTAAPGKWTPLHFAAYFGYEDVAKKLIAKGADRSAKNKDGNTPLDIAKKRNRQEMVDILSKP